jgi:hypothetical protein
MNRKRVLVTGMVVFVAYMLLAVFAQGLWPRSSSSSLDGSLSAAEPLFEDDFEQPRTDWLPERSDAIRIVETGDPAHGKALELSAQGDDVLALIRGSEGWGPIRVEADFQFPTDAHAYLGLVYNLTRTAERTDFGNIYIKGNGSYLRANPLRDGNVSRLLYEEYRTPLVGDAAIRIGQWHRLRAEIADDDCHVYIDDLRVPRMTFDLFEGHSGLVGFKPRVTGDPVRIDNVRVTSIEALAWTGPRKPAIEYTPEELLTQWEVMGPFNAPADEVARGARTDSWRSFETDRRGAVITGRVTEYIGARGVAYFRTTIRSEEDREVTLHVSTTDEIALWVNEDFQGFIYRDGYISGDNDWNAWWDFGNNPDHAGRRVPIMLRSGDNRIVVRVRNGQFASGGFFAAIE